MINDDDTRFTPTEFMLAHRPAQRDTKKRFRAQQATPEAQTAQRNERRYTARSNICPKCFCAMPKIGECC